MPEILTRIYSIQSELPHLDRHERLILKLCANLLEAYHRISKPKNALTDAEFCAIPKRWELLNGMLTDYDTAGRYRPLAGVISSGRKPQSANLHN